LEILLNFLSAFLCCPLVKINTKWTAKSADNEADEWSEGGNVAIGSRQSSPKPNNFPPPFAPFCHQSIHCRRKEQPLFYPPTKGGWSICCWPPTHSLWKGFPQHMADIISRRPLFEFFSFLTSIC
jgi:hypothetical protein